MKLHKICILTGLLLSLSSLGLAATEKYSCDIRLKGYEEGSFVVLKGDAVNLRQRPKDGRVLEEMPRHTLLRVLSREKDWLKVRTDGLTGYVYAPLTGSEEGEELSEEDFSLVKVALDDEYAEVKLSLGQGDRKKKRHGISYYEYDDQLLVGIKDARVCSLTTEKQDYFLARGVGVGDTSARLVGQYGLPSVVVYDDDDIIYEYFLDKAHHERYALAVTVDEQGIIRGLSLEKEA